MSAPAMTLERARELTAAAQGMSEAQTRALLELLMGGTLSPAEGGALLAAWNARGETGLELASLVRGLLERATVLALPGRILDLCGTGGSGLGRYNVSTTAAFVLAASGVRVAKHGNRGSVTANGSFDLLDALQVPFQLSPAGHATVLEHSGVCFLFARLMHPAVAAVAPYRKAAGRRTIFNLAGPLANPGRPQIQLIGVANWAQAEVLAEALERLGVERAVVVQGEPGIDEVSVSGETRWIEVRRQGAHHLRTRGSYRHAMHFPYQELPSGTGPDNARQFAALLAGTGQPGLEAMVSANAAVALDLWHDRALFTTAAPLTAAREALRSGAVLAAFERHRRLAQELTRAAAQGAGET